MESEKISFVKYIDKSFNVFQQLRRFRKGDRKQIFNYLFNAHHIPRMKTWFMAGELVVWGLLALWILITIAVGLIHWTFSQLIATLALFIIIAAFLAALGSVVSAWFACLYLPLSLPLLLLQKTKNLKSYCLSLLVWGLFCFVFSVVWGKKTTKIIWALGGSTAVPTTYIDWINPKQNIWMLIFGYPVLLSILVGAWIISIFYYKYKLQIKEGEGLDAHLLGDNDVDNLY